MLAILAENFANKINRTHIYLTYSLVRFYVSAVGGEHQLLLRVGSVGRRTVLKGWRRRVVKLIVRCVSFQGGRGIVQLSLGKFTYDHPFRWGQDSSSSHPHTFRGSEWGKTLYWLLSSLSRRRSLSVSCMVEKNIVCRRFFITAHGIETKYSIYWSPVFFVFRVWLD